MSWLGGSWSSITGQITNLTKEVLTDGTEEVSDHITELRIANGKIQELEAAYNIQKQEIEHLKIINAELEYKAESTELQINTISREYRAVLEKKEEEINLLKHKQNEYEDFRKNILSTDPNTTVNSSKAVSSYSDDMDFGDVIESQHEINRLVGQVKRLQAECEHWKLKANREVLDGSLSNAEAYDSSHYQAEIKAFPICYKDEVDQHHYQLSALQDHHQRKLAELQKKHDQEVARYQLLLQAQSSKNVSGTLEQASLDQPHSPIDNKDLQDQMWEIQALRNKVSQQETTNMRLKVELEHTSAIEKEKTRTLQVLSRQLEALQAEKTKIIQEKDGLSLNQQHLKEDLERISQENQRFQEEMKRLDTHENHDANRQITEDIQQNSGKDAEVYQPEITTDLVLSLQQELQVLRQKNVNLETQLRDLDESLISVVEDKEQADDIIIKLNKQIRFLQEQIPDFNLKRADSERTLGHESDSDNYGDRISHNDWTTTNISERNESSNLAADLDELETTSSVSETSLKNHELEYQVRTLQAQIDTYERDIEHFELVKPEWQVEKEDLENVISKLKEQLQEKESRLSVLYAKKGLIEVEKNNSGDWSHIDRDSVCSSDIDTHLDNFQRDIDELTQANAQLEEERDILVEEKNALLEELQKLQLQVQLNYSSSRESSPTIVHNIEILLKLLPQLNHTIKTDPCSIESQQILQVLRNFLQQNHEVLDLQTPDQIISYEIKDKLELLQQQIQESSFEKNKLSHELEMSLEKINILEKKCQDEKDEKNSLNNKLLQLNEQLKKQDFYLLEQDELRSEVNFLNEKIEELQKNRVTLEESLNLIKNENFGLISTNEEYHIKQKSLENEIQELQANVKANLEKEKKNQSVLILEHEISKLSSIISQLQQDNNLKQHDIKHLETQLVSLSHDKANLATKVSEYEDKYISQKQEENHTIQELTTQVESLRMQKSDLEEELNETEMKLLSQAKQYENTLYQMSHSRDLDSNALQAEYDKITKENHDNMKLISELNCQLQHKETEIKETKEMLKDAIKGQEQLQEVIQQQEKDRDNLKHEYLELHKNMDNLSHIAEQQELVMSRLQSAEKNLGSQKEENRKLKLALENTTQKPDPKTLDIITDLESEIRVLNEKLLEQESLKINSTNVSQINDNLSTNDFIKSTDKDTEDKKVIFNNQELHELITTFKMYRKLLDPVILKKMDEEIDSQKILIKILESHHKHSLEEKDIDESEFGFENKIQENINKILMAKENEIELLKRKVTSVDDDIKNGHIDLQSLKQQIHHLQIEKEQMLSILNEKSRENSSLKSEVHHLMNVLSSERVMVSKLQQQNQELYHRKEAPDQEMTKEAVQNLSRIIQDKDLEIQALKQKNETLVTVLQDSSPNDAHFHSILQERESLMKQLGTYQNEREQLIAMLNQKHQESITYHSEIQRLNNILFCEKEKSDKLQMELGQVSQQFEDKQKILMNTQNEIVSLRQRVTDLEHKYQQIRNKYDEKLQNEKSNSMILIEKKDVENKDEEIIKMNEIIKDKERWLFEKDRMIHDKVLQLQRVEESCKRKEEEVASLKRQIEKQIVEREGYLSELNNTKTEYTITAEKLADQAAEITVMKEANNKMTMTLHEKEFELGAVTEKVASLTKLVQEKDVGHINMEQILQESEAMRKQAQEFHQERDQVMLALNQRQNENKDLQQEVRSVKEKNLRLNKELERLRTHLIQIEESYTREVLHSEEREKELRNRLATAEEKLLSSSSAVHNASLQASLQVESLQEQLHVIAEQRDDALLQLSNSQEQVQQYCVSLSNLQLVLEQFQKEKENQFFLEIEKYQKELQAAKAEAEMCRKQVRELQFQYDETADALAAAQRLSEQLDKKQELITALQMEVKERDDLLQKSQDKISHLTTTNDSKVDKLVIKNLFLGYFTSPQNKKPEVLRLVGSVLNFSKEDILKVTNEKQKTSWMPSILRSGPPSSTQTTPVVKPSTPIVSDPLGNKSFSELFVKFLEMESSPSSQHVLPLPAEEMAKEMQKKTQGTTNLVRPKPINPFTAPMYGSSDNSHLLLKPISETLPTFMPLASPGPNRETPSSILKDILQR